MRLLNTMPRLKPKNNFNFTWYKKKNLIPLASRNSSHFISSRYDFLQHNSLDNIEKVGQILNWLDLWPKEGQATLAISAQNNPYIIVNFILLKGISILCVRLAGMRRTFTLALRSQVVVLF